MISITSWVAFQVAESAPQGPLQRPRPQPLGHLPDAVTEESQASEKSEASPSSTVRENRDGPVSFEDAQTDRRGAAETRGKKVICGALNNTHGPGEGGQPPGACVGFAEM